MDIVRFPHPSLFKICEPVTDFGPGLKITLDLMWKTMQEARGQGLAANQVGLEHRIVVMRGSDNERLYMVNPTIKWMSRARANLREGCLSALNEFLIVPSRSDLVVVGYVDENNIPKSVKLQGIYAVCAQHELDHLQGRSFMEDESISKAKRQELARKWGLKR